MFVTFEPDGDAQQRQTFDFTPDDVRTSEAEMVERRYGQNWDAFLDGVRSGNAKARRVLLWHLLRRDHHTLRYEDTPDFRMGEFTVEFSSAEIAVLRDQILKMDSAIPADERDAILGRLEADLTEALLRERGEDVDADDADDADDAELEPGKAPSNTSA